MRSGMRAAEGKLAAGEWVHIFPEGTRSSDGITMGAIKAGIGHLIASCQDADPLVIPIIHDGMQRVMPRGCKLPVPGQTVCPLSALLVVLSLLSSYKEIWRAAP